MFLKRWTNLTVMIVAATAVLGWFPLFASASLVKNVRLGIHPDHTRVVVDLSGPFTYRLENPEPKKVSVRLNGASLRSGLKSLSVKGGLVDSVRAVRDGKGITLEIALNAPSRVNAYTWSKANRLILELGPKPKPLEKKKTGEPGPALAEKSSPDVRSKTDVRQNNNKEDGAKGVEPKPLSKNESKKPPLENPEQKPKQDSPPKSAMGFFLSAQKSPVPQAVIPAEENRGDSKEEASTDETAAAEPRDEPTAESESEVTKKIEPLQKVPEQKEAGGGLVAVEETPTTLGLTMRVKPKPSAESGPVLMDEDPPRPSAKPGQVAEKARQAAEKPQGGTKGELSTATAIFNQALEHFKQARYDEALQLFEDAEALSPDSSIGEKALFYQADSLFKLYKETGFPSFDRVEKAYQKAIGVFPDSIHVSRALLRMGIVNYETGNADKAKGFFNILLKEYPKAKEAVEGRVYLARLFLDENKPRQGIRLLRQVIAENPDSPHVKTALWYLGRVLFEVGRFVEAYQRLSALHKGWPEFYLKEPMLHYYLGETAFRLDKQDQARKYLFWVANISPEISNLDLILTRIGETYRLQKNYRKAAVLYTEAQRRFPESDGALISRIRLAENKNEKQGKAPKLDKVLGIELSLSARKTYQGIIDKYPDREVAQLAMLKLGALHFQNKKYQEAFKILKELLTKHPGTEFYRDAAFALRQSFDQRMKQLAAKKETFKLLSFYDSFKDNLPQELKAKYAHLLGDAYFNLKLYDRAKELYQESIKAGNKNPRVELNLALSHFNLGEDEAAEKAFQTFVKTYPAHGKVNIINLFRGQALVHLKRPEEAAAVLGKVLKKGRESRYYLPAVSLLAETRLRTDKPEKAVELLTRVLPQVPDEKKEKSELTILLGEALLAGGRAKEAAKVLAKALQDIPLDAEHAGVHYRLGLAYLEAGKMKNAREVLNKVAGSKNPFWAKMAGNRLSVAELSVRLSARQEVANK